MRSILALSTLLAAGAILAQTYKWTDEEGIVHYSDRPHEGAEVVYLSTDRGRQESAYASTPVQTVFTARNDTDEANKPDPFRYDSISVVSPGAEETLWNIGGVLDVTLDIQPALQPGHRLNVYFDGSPITVNTASFQIREVFRGSHNLQAEIIDNSGRLMIRSEAARFYVQQTSINRAN